METPATSPADYPRRFGWGMRMFLSLFLFDMIFRAMVWGLGEFGTPPANHDDALAALPSREEFSAGTRCECYTASLRSAGRFLVPWPNAADRDGIESLADAGAYAVHWLMTRLEFLGNVTGIDQRWRMFGSVFSAKDLPGVRLVFVDGSSRIVHGAATPPDVSRFSRWFNEKRLQAEMNAAVNDDARLGYAKWLANRHARNEAGSRLTSIEFFVVVYERPPPGSDIGAALQSRKDPLGGPREPVFWRYDVAARIGRPVSSR
jgi:hypothetical protein